MFIRRLLATGLFVLIYGVLASAQSNPQTQPLIQQSAMKYLGNFVAPWDCGNGFFFGYGGVGGSVSPDGLGLWLGGYDAGRPIGELLIPSVFDGRTAQVRTPCFYPTGIDDIIQGAGGMLVGGTLQQGDELLITGYAFYDGGGAAINSHAKYNLKTKTMTPFTKVGTLGAGFVAGYMGLVAPEWRSIFGCSILTGQSSLSIISRTSSGPAVHCLVSPELIGREASSIQSLLYYPHDKAMAGGAANPLWQRSDTIGGFAMPPGSRSALFVGRHGTGENCYGTVPPCNDPVHPDKGDHNYPYRYQVWAYDNNDLVAVKNGLKLPWDVRPYATWTLSEMGTQDRATLRPGGAAFDPVKRRWYVAAPAWGGGPNRVHVYEIAGPSAQPPTEICGDQIDNDGDGLIDEGCPVDCVVSAFTLQQPVAAWEPSVCPSSREQTRPEVWTRTVITQASNGGAACPALSEPRVGRQTCTPAAEYPGTIVSVPTIFPGTPWWGLSITLDLGGTYIVLTGNLLDPPLKLGDRITMKVERR